jgi:hypothetical protein
VRRGAALALLLAAAAAAAPPAAPREPFRLLGAEVPGGEERQLSLFVSDSFVGYSMRTPVLVSVGREAGPTLCLTAGIHGDELNGTEVVRRVFERLDPATLRGALVGIPIVNLHGFRRGSRYLPDRRDLNRYFPGNAWGSAASRIAHGVFERVVRHCGALVDLHSGSFHRSNLPQLRGDLSDPRVLELARGFASAVTVHSPGRSGTLRRAATEAGIPAVTYEAGEPLRLENPEVEAGVQGVQHLLAALGMTPPSGPPGEPQPVYLRSRWVRVDADGILIARVALGDQVAKGDVLGTVTDPITNDRSVVHAPWEGRLIGLAANQVVIPGFAAFHLGFAGGEADPLAAVEEGEPVGEAAEPPLSDMRLDPEELPE